MLRLRRVIVYMLLLALPQSMTATDYLYVAGKVLDSSSKPLPYASIFFKHHPQVGGVSDDKGKFNIKCSWEDSQTADDIMKDTVIVSMLGYETLYVPAGQFGRSRYLTLRMKEYRYTLDEAHVKASKNARKHHKSEMKRILGRIYDRLMTVDAPKSTETYRIVSDIVVLRDSTPITIDHLTGSLTEIPQGKQNGKDSIVIKTDTYSNYMDSTVRTGIRNLNVDKLKKKEKKAVHKAGENPWDKTIPHKVLWSITDVKTVLDATAEEVRYWDSTEKDDSTLTVSYSRRKAFLGIVSATQHLYLTVDRTTFAIRAASCDINAEFNLPFGYKLNPGELEILNMVNLNEEDIEKFKIKTADIQVKGMEINRAERDRMVPSEKSMKNTVSIADRKDNRLDFTNTCSLRVLD